MRKIIILSAATLILSSCGIYNKYKPVSEVPEGLYGSESVAATDTANFGNLSWREVFTDPYLPMGFGYELGGMAREEAQTSGSTTGIIFVLCFVFVYLLLSEIGRAHV